MGLRNGYIVATTGKFGLLEELSRHTGVFTVDAVVERPNEVELDGGAFDLLLGERDGKAFLVDSSMVLSNEPDMIIAMSTSLGTVVGCGAETVSGTYWLTAAADGKPLRFVFWSSAGMTKGMAMGEPLPSEEEHPIVDSTGDGVVAAMAGFGLDPSAWLDAGPGTIVRYDFSRPAEDGPIAKVRRQHTERYKRPEDEWLNEIVAGSRGARRPGESKRT